LQFTEVELRTLESIRKSRSAPQRCETLQHDQVESAWQQLGMAVHTLL
jgi:hypothetical protein